MATAVPVTHSAPVVSPRRPARLCAFARGGWRPALGWALTPCTLYSFIVGPLIGRPADAAELVARFGAAGVLVAAPSFDTARGRAGARPRLRLSSRPSTRTCATASCVTRGCA